jgi:hypothetical protein
MTRLVGGMPYDCFIDQAHAFTPLVQELKRAFLKRIRAARDDGVNNQGDLRLFAGHCRERKCHCITFNYDDVLDEALWTYSPGHGTEGSWSPDWGYGFPCRMSESCVRDTPAIMEPPSAMLLFKMHGSLNWKIPLGQTQPCVVEAIRHHEKWFQHNGRYPEKIDLTALADFLEPDSLIVPPVLTKGELTQRPVLRLTWHRAKLALRAAQRIVFIGYSLPLTDIAAGFLFREGLAHLSSDQITVVDLDFDACDTKRERHRSEVICSYRKVFPSISEASFEFCGAVDWIRNNLVDWLYDSTGYPVAFRALREVVSVAGTYIGKITLIEGRQEVWDGQYKGEIVDGNRLYCVDSPRSGDGEPTEPPRLPGVGQLPPNIGSVQVRRGYRDVE